jgi:hypothetical protein
MTPFWGLLLNREFNFDIGFSSSLGVKVGDYAHCGINF